MQSKEFLGGRVIVKVGDITREPTDAVVNAANSTLLGGGGVDGAIHRAGGAQILAECREIRRREYPDGLPVGKAIITAGGNLPAKYVIHTVGPVYGTNQGRDAELLAACYRSSLALAAEKNIISIAFPAISTGAFGYPQHEAARIASAAIKEFLTAAADNDESVVAEVRLVFFSAPDAEKFIRHQEF